MLVFSHTRNSHRVLIWGTRAHGRVRIMSMCMCACVCWDRCSPTLLVPQRSNRLGQCKSCVLRPASLPEAQQVGQGVQGGQCGVPKHTPGTRLQQVARACGCEGR